MPKYNPRKRRECPHTLEKLPKPMPSLDGGKPYIYMCTKCKLLLKIASGVILK